MVVGSESALKHLVSQRSQAASWRQQKGWGLQLLATNLCPQSCERRERLSSYGAKGHGQKPSTKPGENKAAKLCIVWLVG